MKKLLSAVFIAFAVWLGVAVIGGIVTIVLVANIDQVLGTTIETPDQPLIAHLIWGVYFFAQFIFPAVYLYSAYKKYKSSTRPL